MTADAWVAVSVAVVGVVITLLLALVVSGLKTLRSDQKAAFVKLQSEIDVLGERVNGVLARVGNIELDIRAIKGYTQPKIPRVAGRKPGEQK